MASHPQSQAGGMDGTDCSKPSVSMQCWEAFGKVQAQACQTPYKHGDGLGGSTHQRMAWGRALGVSRVLRHHPQPGGNEKYHHHRDVLVSHCEDREVTWLRHGAALWKNTRMQPRASDPSNWLFLCSKSYQH